MTLLQKKHEYIYVRLYNFDFSKDFIIHLLIGIVKNYKA